MMELLGQLFGILLVLRLLIWAARGVLDALTGRHSK